MQKSIGAPTQETVEDVNGLKIFFRSWRPEEKSRATVVIIPGFNAHSGYYEWVAGQFVADGLAVYTVDLRGRGQSYGERFYVETFENYVRDVEAVMAVVKSREPGFPILLLGHSAGGVVACLYALDHQAELKRINLRKFCARVTRTRFCPRVFQGVESCRSKRTYPSPTEREIFSRPQGGRNHE
jgi:acylglycerol lipase